MRRKLVQLDTFGQMERKSLSKIEHELMEAENILARTLGTGPLSFKFFDGDKAVYRTDKGTYLHANYQIKENQLVFEDVHELVIDQDSQLKRLRENAGKIVDSIIDNDRLASSKAFQEWVSEYCRMRSAQKPIAEGRKNPFEKSDKKKSFMKKKGFEKCDQRKVAVGERKIREWHTVARQVMEYCDFVDTGSALAESDIRRVGDEVVAVRIPTSQARNEAKMLQLTYKNMLKTDLVYLREQGLQLPSRQSFVEAICAAKRQKNMGREKEVEASFEHIATESPAVLALTMTELAAVIGQSLEAAGDGNYDDDTCKFLAEGILRTAFIAYPDKVEQIVRLAGSSDIPQENGFARFQEVAGTFFPSLDEAAAREAAMFEDLFNASIEVRRAATEGGNDTVRSESTQFLSELHAILNGEQKPDQKLAEETAEWLGAVAESSMFGGSLKDWKVQKGGFHVTDNGDNPALSGKANTSGNPVDGDWWKSPGGPAVGDDGSKPKPENTRKMGRKGLGNIGKYPDISNPYIPSAKIPTLKGEPGVDKNYASDGEGMWQYGDKTWPGLDNPNTPPSKRVHVSDDNRVDNGRD